MHIHLKRGRIVREDSVLLNKEGLLNGRRLDRLLFASLSCWLGVNARTCVSLDDRVGVFGPPIKGIFILLSEMSFFILGDLFDWFIIIFALKFSLSYSRSNVTLLGIVGLSSE